MEIRKILVNSLSLIKWLIICYFVLQLVVDFFYIFIFDKCCLSKMSLVLLATLILILLVKNKLTWIFGIILFSYGLYSIFFTGLYASEPENVINFTQPSIELFKSNLYPKFERFLLIFPSLFYLVCLIAFITKPILMGLDPRVRDKENQMD